MLLTEKREAETTSRSIWIFMLVIAATITIDAVLLFALVNMFTLGQLILMSLSVVILAAGLMVTVAEFIRPAKPDSPSHNLIKSRFLKP
jgi:hypothetical protein